MFLTKIVKIFPFIPGELAQDDIFCLQTVSWSILIVNGAVPCLLLVVFNVTIIRAILEHKRMSLASRITHKSCHSTEDSVGPSEVKHFPLV